MTPADLTALAKALSPRQRSMMKGRHSLAGNPWPFIGIRERAGGAKDRMFQHLIAAGYYDRGNNLTPLGLALRAHLLAGEGGW